MVVGDVGRRDQDAGRTGGGQLIAGRGTGTADDDVSRSHQGGHVVDVLADVDGGAVFKINALLLHQFGHPVLAEGAGGVDVVEGEAVFLLQDHQVSHGAVHSGCAQAAEGGNQQLLIGQAQFSTGSFPGGFQELLADGHAHDFNFLGLLVVLAALLEADQNAGGNVGSQLGGQAGNGVGFVDDGGDAQLGACVQRREAGVAAGTDDDVGTKFLDDFLAAGHSAQDALDGLGVLLDAGQAQGAAQAGAGQGLQLIARLGNQLLFHMALSADEEDVGVGMTLRNYIGHSDGRVDMTAGAAAGKDHIHNIKPPVFYNRFDGGRCSERSPFPPDSPPGPFRRRRRMAGRCRWRGADWSPPRGSGWSGWR